jgi:hypothetical protein
VKARTIGCAVVLALSGVLTSSAAAEQPVRTSFSVVDEGVDNGCGFPILFTAKIEITILDRRDELLVLRKVDLTATANGRTAWGNGAQNGPVDLVRGTVTLTGTLHLTAPGGGVILLTAGRVVYDLTTVPFEILFEAGPHEYRQAGLPGDTNYERLCSYFAA